MNSLQESSNRVIWVDIYKALAIILVVVGHATGAFNSYIYQFHMAAFFFISGYTINFEKRNFLRTIWDNFFTLMIPFFSAFIILFGIEVILQKLGIRNLILGDFQYLGILGTIGKLFSKGEIYAWFLSAGWFIVVLFAVKVLAKFLNDVVIDNLFIYTIISIFLYAFGRWMVNCGYHFHIGMFSFNKILIGHFYFAIGHFMKSSGFLSHINNKLAILYKSICLIISVCCLVVFKHYNCTIDMVSDTYRHNMWLEAIVGINGCLLLFFISIFFEYTHFLKKSLIYIGKNTLGIVFFHFLFFKPTQLLLIIINKKNLSLLTEFVPKSYGNYSWLLFVPVTITFSIGLWLLLLKIPFTRILFGKEIALYDKWRNNTKKTLKNIFSLDLDCLNISNYINKQRTYIISNTNWILPTCFTILVVIPMLTQGVICNDELQINTWLEGGFVTSYKHWFLDQIVNKGRTLAAPYMAFCTTITEVFGGPRSPFNRIVPVCFHLISILLFQKFIKKITENNLLANSCAIVCLAFTPLLIEHTLPNAFSYYLPAFIMLLGSFNLFFDYLSQKKKQKLYLSIGLFFVTCCAYELFVTYIFIYYFIILKIQKQKIFSKDNIIAFLPIGVTGIAFVILYYICGIVFPSNYAGNQIAFSLKGAIKVLYGMFRSAIPGSFTFSSKYNWISTLYSINLLPIDYFRIISVVLIFSLLIYQLLKNINRESEKKSTKKIIITFCCSFIYMILPALPNSLGQMYQNDFNNGNWWLALPVSYFLFYAAVFSCCWCLWNFAQFVNNKITSKVFPAIMALIFGVYLFPVQRLNSIISIQQYKDWNRICDIHDFLETNYVKEIGSAKVYAPDFFELRNLLAIDDGHYNLWLRLNGHTLEVINQNAPVSLSEEEWLMSMPNDKYFIIAGHGKIVVASKEILNDNVLVPAANGIWQKASLVRQWQDKEFIFYETDTFYGSELEAIGKTLNRSLKIKGRHSDGWLEKKSEFKIKTGEEGLIDFTFYYPFDDFEGKFINLKINDQEYAVTVDNNNINYTANAPANKIVNIQINCLWEIPENKKNGDIRELSIILSKMEGR